MMKNLITGLVCLFITGLAYADSTWQPNEFQSEQYVLNKVYDSTTNTLSGTITGFADLYLLSADVISTDRIFIQYPTDRSKFISIDVAATYAAFKTSGISAMRFIPDGTDYLQFSGDSSNFAI